MLLKTEMSGLSGAPSYDAPSRKRIWTKNKQLYSLYLHNQSTASCIHDICLKELSSLALEEVLMVE